MPIIGTIASGISGNLIPTPPVANPTTWIDASLASSVTLSSGKVTQINDLSGNGRNLVQATSLNQPTYSTNVKNGKNAMLFSGQQWVRQSSNWTPTDPITFYIVIMMSDSNTRIGTGWTNYRLDYSNYQTNNMLGAGWQVEGGNIMQQSSASNFGNNTWYYLTIIRYPDTGNGSTYVNNSFGSSGVIGGTPAAMGSGVLTLGTRSDNAVPMSGYIGEALMYNGAHNGTQRNAVWSYLANKWNI